MDFHKDTSADVARALTNAKATGTRVRVWYGDTATGKAWPEEHDVLGYIGNSTGSIKTPLIIHNKRSMGGPALLDHCIVRIDTTSGCTLYKHPTFNAGIWLQRNVFGPVEQDGTRYNFVVLHNGELHAKFTSGAQADKYIAFMLGERYSK